ncbi:MAG: ABC transporter substrate-binding protein [Alphaproteobacteria bacterium]
MVVNELADPANMANFEQATVVHQICDYITRLGKDNVTRPSLAESWSSNDDLTVWKFKIRKGVKFSNGDDLTASVVKKNIDRWLAPNSKSSNKSALSNVKKVSLSGRTITLKLSKPELAIPEMLNNYTCAILHPDYDGSTDWTKSAIGTGAFKLKSYKTGRKVELVRNENYWRRNAYLDKITIVDLGNKTEVGAAALASNQVDLLHAVGPADLEIIEATPNVKLFQVKTAATDAIRMNLKNKPFDNKKLRQAIVACVDTRPYVEDVMRNTASYGENTHISETHPEYPGKIGHKQDYKKAKRLIKEAGYPNGLELEIVTGNTNGVYQQELLQILQKQVAPIGIKLKIKIVTVSAYWKVWTKAPFAITVWGGRPLGTMVYNLAYRTGAKWNESAYSNSKFDKLLDKANATADVAKRSKIMKKAQDILYDDAVLVQPHFRNILNAGKENIVNGGRHKQGYYTFEDVYFK